VKLYWSADVTVANAKNTFKGYKSGPAFIGILVMNDFFYGSDEHGDLNDFVKKHPGNAKPMFMSEIKRMIKTFGFSHGDLHPGNIIYRRKGDRIDIAIIDFGYASGSLNGPENFVNKLGRPTHVNKNNPLVHRVKNSWYLNHWYI
jgi:serine/threonine protein kinase